MELNINILSVKGLYKDQNNFLRANLITDFGIINIKLSEISKHFSEAEFFNLSGMKRSIAKYLRKKKEKNFDDELKHALSEVYDDNDRKKISDLRKCFQINDVLEINVESVEKILRKQSFSVCFVESVEEALYKLMKMALKQKKILNSIRYEEAGYRETVEEFINYINPDIRDRVDLIDEIGD